MRDNWKKILIFVGLVIVQIGLAYGLVTYILPPGRVNNFANSNIDTKKKTKKNESKEATISASESNTDSTITNEPPQEEPVDTTFSNRTIDTSAVDVSSMIEGMNEYLEDEVSEKELSNAYTFTIEEIIVNPAQTRGTRYVVISLSVIIKGKNIESRLDPKMPAIKDAINTLISRKTVLWLSDIDNRPFLREEIKILMESIIGDAKVLRLYFTKYIFQ